MVFLVKKVVGEAFMPLPMVVFLAAAGGVLLWRGRRPRLGRGLVVGAFVLLWVASCEPLTVRGVAVLEGVHPVFPGDSVDAVVVLGSSHVSDPSVPPGARLSGQALYRLTEGVRIAVAQPWTELILSGHPAGQPSSNAAAYRDAALSLGVPAQRITLEARAPDTAAEARLLAPRLEGRRFALVTSATHMPRAVALFRARGLTPVPAPTGHESASAPGFDWRLLLPRSQALGQAHQLWYEVLGGVWIRLTGQV